MGNLCGGLFCCGILDVLGNAAYIEKGGIV